MRDTKVERFLPKNQLAPRKLLNFQNWINGGQNRRVNTCNGIGADDRYSNELDTVDATFERGLLVIICWVAAIGGLPHGRE